VLKFVMIFTYSSASWARMLKVPEDRASAVAALMEHFRGSLESIYWEVETASSYVVADLPDSVSATAVIAAAKRPAPSGRSTYMRCSLRINSATRLPWPRVPTRYTAHLDRPPSSGISSSEIHC
jgi:uncharacterized protein with GYD domain